MMNHKRESIINVDEEATSKDRSRERALQAGNARGGLGESATASERMPRLLGERRAGPAPLLTVRMRVGRKPAEFGWNRKESALPHTWGRAFLFFKESESNDPC
jgi:hypothetical protein